MYEEDDAVQLISSRSLPKGNGRGRRQRGADEVYALSESELGRNNEDEDFEETTVFSDSLYGDSLPSMRAQLAATQMKHRRRRNMDRADSEKRALVSSSESEGGGTSTTVLENSFKKEAETSTHGQYSSLGGNILPRKRRKKEMTMT